MARYNQNLQTLRIEAINAMYAELSNKKEGNVYVYKHEYILEKISKKFFLAPKTIMKIIKK